MRCSTAAASRSVCSDRYTASGALEAVIDGIADEVDQRVGQIFDHGLVEFLETADDIESEKERLRQWPDSARLFLTHPRTPRRSASLRVLSRNPSWFMSSSRSIVARRPRIR